MTAVLASLNPAALVTLADCEQRIERGLRSFRDIGAALAEIRDSRLYRASHGTFEDYCNERWNLTPQHANRLILAAAVADSMEPTGSIPSSERQARELAKLPEADRLSVWSAALELTDGKPTADAIRKAAEARTQTPGPVTSPQEAPTTGSGQIPGPTGAERRPPADPGTTPAPVVDDSTAAPAAPPREPDQTPEPAAVSTAPIGSGPDVAAAPREGGAAAAPALRLVPTDDEKQAAVQRDARGLLLRAVEILAPDHDRPGFAATWARHLGPYDAELSELIRRALDAIATLDDLIERCGQ